jgi:Tfp pilus assembly protein PilN
VIRIDLGKGSRKQGEGMRKVASQLKLQQPYEELLAKFDNDASRLVAFFAAIGVAVLPYLFMGEYKRVVTNGYERKIVALDKELAVIGNEIQSLTPFKQELESYETQKRQVSQRLEVIHRLIDGRGTPVATLDAVGQTMPDGCWLEAIVYEGIDKVAEKVNLAGRAMSNEEISDFIDRLSQSSYLKSVKLNSVEAGQSSGQDVRVFSIDLEANSQPEAVPAVRQIGSK